LLDSEGKVVSEYEGLVYFLRPTLLVEGIK